MVSSHERRLTIVPRINHWSSTTLIFIPPSMFIGFRLFVLLKRRSEQVCKMPWKVRWSVVPWANRSVGASSCPASPRPTAPLCAAPTRPARGVRIRDFESTSKSFIPGHPLDEKRLQKQKGVGLLASIPERRVAVVPFINRLLDLRTV